MNLKDQRSQALSKAQSIVDAVKAAGRNMSDAEKYEVDSLLGEIKSLDEKIRQAAEDAQRLKAVGELFGSSDSPNEPGGDSHSGRSTTAGVGSKGYLSQRSISKAAEKAAASLAGKGAFGVKALVGNGALLLEVDRILDSPVTLGKPASTIWDLIPVKEVEPTYSYLRQVTRDNKAAPVARGDLKPTSTYQLERVEARLRTYAHLSDPAHVLDIVDYDALVTFLSAEMRYGLFLAIEADALSGDGTGEHMTGMLNTSGVFVQAHNTDATLSIRSAITSLEANGSQPDGIFLHPRDWEAIETSPYLLNDAAASPVDRAARRLWGLPVALSNAVPEGTGVVKSVGSVMLAINSRGTELSLGVVGDDFARNQVRARLEGRANLDVIRPQGVAKVALRAA